MPAMPFGRYRNWPLTAVPTDYLRWLAAKVDLYPPLDQYVAAELRRRLAPPPRPPTPEPTFDLPAIVRTWHRRLILKYHPDRGGSHDAMIAVNDAHALLQELIAKAQDSSR